jgi:pimeloyl-ACP methyl ester carboxylesterase
MHGITRCVRSTGWVAGLLFRLRRWSHNAPGRAKHGLLVCDGAGGRGAGHMVNMERPAEFNRAVLDFLDH